MYLDVIFLSLQVMDNYWNSHVLEFGAVNITGFRILQPNSIDFRSFLHGWKIQDARSPEDAKKQVSVSILLWKQESNRFSTHSWKHPKTRTRNTQTKSISLIILSIDITWLLYYCLLHLSFTGGWSSRESTFLLPSSFLFWWMSQEWDDPSRLGFKIAKTSVTHFLIRVWLPPSFSSLSPAIDVWWN